MNIWYMAENHSKVTVWKITWLFLSITVAHTRELSWLTITSPSSSSSSSLQEFPITIVIIDYVVLSYIGRCSSSLHHRAAIITFVITFNFMARYWARFKREESFLRLFIFVPAKKSIQAKRFEDMTFKRYFMQFSVCLKYFFLYSARETAIPQIWSTHVLGTLSRYFVINQA